MTSPKTPSRFPQTLASLFPRLRGFEALGLYILISMLYDIWRRDNIDFPRGFDLLSSNTWYVCVNVLVDVGA